VAPESWAIFDKKNCVRECKICKLVILIYCIDFSITFQSLSQKNFLWGNVGEASKDVKNVMMMLSRGGSSYFISVQLRRIGLAVVIIQQGSK